MGSQPFVAVVGHRSEIDREEGAAAILRGLGAKVRTIDLWDDPDDLFHDDAEPRALLLEALDRPDLAAAALRSVRRDARLAEIGTLLAVTWAEAPRIDPAIGFDDFVLAPYVPAELYARVRQVEWRRSDFTTEERIKMGGIVLDRSAHEVLRDGTRVSLSPLEFSMLAYLAQHRGRVVSRDELLQRVWGNRYDGTARAVDIRVCHLRDKLGAALPLRTVRGEGYRLDVNLSTSPRSEAGPISRVMASDQSSWCDPSASSTPSRRSRGSDDKARASTHVAPRATPPSSPPAGPKRAAGASPGRRRG